MATRGATILAASSFVGAGSSLPLTWAGGRTSLVITAAAYGTIALQYVALGGAVPISSSLLSNQSFVFDAPPGLYALSNSASSSVGVSAILTPIPYNL